MRAKSPAPLQRRLDNPFALVHALRFELQRGVPDAEAFAEHLLRFQQALLPVHRVAALRDEADMRAERGFGVRDAPDVQVVHLRHMLVIAERMQHRVIIDPRRRTVDQDVRGAPEQPQAAPEDQQTDQHAGDGVGGVPTRCPDHRPGNDRTNRAQRIADEMQERPLDIDAVLGVPHQHPGAAGVGQQPRDSDRQHPRRIDLLGCGEAAPGLDENKADDHDQRRAIDERPDHFSPQQAEGAPRRARRARHIDYGDGQGERGDVGKHVPGVCQQRQAVREDAAGDLNDQPDEVDPQRPPQAGQRRAVRRMGMAACALGVAMLMVLMCSSAHTFYYH